MGVGWWINRSPLSPLYYPTTTLTNGVPSKIEWLWARQKTQKHYFEGFLVGKMCLEFSLVFPLRMPKLYRIYRESVFSYRNIASKW